MTKQILILVCSIVGINSFAFALDPAIKEIDSLHVQSVKAINEVITAHKANYRYAHSEFNEAYLNKHFPQDTVVNEAKAKAKAVIDQLEKIGRYVDKITRTGLTLLPVGVKVKIGNITYIMGVSHAKITKEYVDLTVFVRISLPQQNGIGGTKQLFFGGQNIRLSQKGGIYEEASIVLLGDQVIPINGDNAIFVLKGGLDMVSLLKKGDDKQTYVTINCKGFKEMGISAEVLFPRSMLEPVDAKYDVIKDQNKKVTASFKTVVGDWNDIMAEINLPPFQLASKNAKFQFIFEVKKAIFDFSDTRNHSDIKFPSGYHKNLIPGHKDTWRGVYINTLNVVLPKEFKLTKTPNRISFSATNLLIDGEGVSGNFTVKGLIPLDKGDAGGWQFSVDRLEAGFVKNNIVKGGFGGEIILPVATAVIKPTQNTDTTKVTPGALSYTAIIDPTNEKYTLTVKVAEDLKFDLFAKAEVLLSTGSLVELEVEDNQFRPKAILHGKLAIKTDIINFEGITFRGLQLQTQQPYIQVQNLGYEGKLQFGSFPITLSNISFTSSNNQTKLGFAIGLNLMNQTGFAGNTSLTIKGKLDDKAATHQWRYEGIEVDAINISADLGSIKLKGRVEIKRADPIYGNGFYGALEADFNAIKVTAEAWFGYTTYVDQPNFRYWYVDAYADFSKLPAASKPPICPGLRLNGFGGGAYYKMAKNRDQQSKSTPSGQAYVPSKGMGLGFKAIVAFEAEGGNAITGKLGFEMEFNANGGLMLIILFGEAHMAQSLGGPSGGGNMEKLKTKLKKLEEKTSKLGVSDNKLKSDNPLEYTKKAFPNPSIQEGIDAYFAMEMDFENQTFHAQLDVYINMGGGGLKGQGDGGHAGSAVFHAEREIWYLHVGTIDNRIGVIMTAAWGKTKIQTYLMIGHEIPSSPPPPHKVAEILGMKNTQLDYMRDLNALGNGHGFAFGASLEIDTGDITFLIFYARLQAGLGFDVMLKDYGQGAACKGRTGVLGINGWYANGQAYAYLQGELGIHVQLLFIDERIPILKAAAAVLLQAKLPNPSWFRGYVGGKYDLLGGLVRGNFRFKLELGEECEIVGGSPLGGVKIIADMTPRDGSSETDVFTKPQAVFNMRINKPFEWEQDKSTKTYRIQLDKFEVTQNGTPVRGKTEWNDNYDAVSFSSFEILPPNTELQMMTRVSFQEKKGGTWTTLMQDGNVAIEEATATFTTGAAPNYINPSNIVYNYPVTEQRYFHAQEQREGYIKLNQGRSDLFYPNTDWTQHMLIEGLAAAPIKTVASYTPKEKMVHFALPADGWQPRQGYILKIISTPPQIGAQVEKEEIYVSQETGQEGNTIEIKNTIAEDLVQEGLDTDMLVYNFTTSIYATFAEKVKAKVATRNYLNPIYADVHFIETDTKPTERWDILELKGGQYTNYQPLVQTEAELNDAYYRDNMYPCIYEDYPWGGLTLDRDTDKKGLPPKKGIDILLWYPLKLEKNPNDRDRILDTRMPYYYNLPWYYKSDFIDLQRKAASLPSGTLLERHKELIRKIFLPIKTGKYKVKMQYIMPGGRLGTHATFTYKNPD